jgi:2-amino-4-hydroxy-6-hydroxymethyldihydropteridine diphosphokinase
MNRVLLLLGSNLGDALAHLTDAKNLIESTIGLIYRSSSVYGTKAWGKQDQSDFLNQVIEISTTHSAIETLRSILKIETQLGRVRQEKWGSRLIDIDILFFNSEIIHYPDLEIPHPQIIHRRFTLIPLSEIVPEFIHPVLKKTLYQLLTECTDTLEVIKLKS